MVLRKVIQVQRSGGDHDGALYRPVFMDDNGPLDTKEQNGHI